jgi:cohesin domain-containing protein
LSITTGARLAALILAVAVSFQALPQASAQDQTAAVEAVPLTKDVSPDKDVQVEVRVKDATNLGAFTFVLSVDPNILQPVSTEKTDYLGSSGREVFCPAPTIDSASVLYNCVTLRPTPAGVDGSGTLAVVTLHSKGKGSTDLTLGHVKLTHPEGDEIPSTTSNGRLSVSSDSGFFGPLTITIIAVAAVVAIAILGAGAFAMNRKNSAATADRPLGSR